MGFSCTPPPCGCKPILAPQQRTINHIDIVQNFNGTDGWPSKIWGKGPNGTAFYHELDSRDPTTSTGPITWIALNSGDYIMKYQAVIDTTSCNMLPSVTPLVQINVHVRCALHRGTSCGGTLDGGESLPPGTGYYQFPGTDAPNTDDWGGCESTSAVIAAVGEEWGGHGHGARMGIGDISRQGGGAFPPHTCHQNGLDIDARYMRADETEQPLDLSTSPADYSRPLTLELLQIWAGTGAVDSIIVDPAAGITSAEVPGVTIIVDSSGEHRNHYHVLLKDADGLDSNNC
jgi:hypothetical protein